MSVAHVNTQLPALHPGKSADVGNAWAAETSQGIVARQTLCSLQASPVLQTFVVISSVGNWLCTREVATGFCGIKW